MGAFPISCSYVMGGWGLAGGWVSHPT